MSKVVQNSGYSGTPLAKKLGIKPDCKLALINQPEYYFELFADFPDDVQILDFDQSELDLVHVFTHSTDEMISYIIQAKRSIKQNGIIWISWPKKASKLKTDITEDTIRNYALGNGLVDVKVCSINEIYSGLKLVIPLKLRR